jgi:hypothetical protein
LLLEESQSINESNTMTRPTDRRYHSTVGPSGARATITGLGPKQSNPNLSGRDAFTTITNKRDQELRSLIAVVASVDVTRIMASHTGGTIGTTNTPTRSDSTTPVQTRDTTTSSPRYGLRRFSFFRSSHQKIGNVNQLPHNGLGG